MQKSPIILAVLLALSYLSTAQSYDNIEFVENKGQWDSRVKLKGEVNAGAVFIRSTGFTILQHNQQDYANLAASLHGYGQSSAMPSSGTQKSADGKLLLRSHSWNVDFVGASPATELIPDKAIPTYNNYFIGNDPSKWASNCQIYQAVTLKEIYPNVDVRYYTYNGALKYDIVARPGANISKIALKYEGIDKLSVQNKELVLNTSIGTLKESYPYSYTFQTDGKGRKEVSCKYTVKDNIVHFEVKDHDPAATLIIDPTLIFCSLSKSTANNWGFTATYGPDGSFFGGGIVFGGNSFPVSPGAFQTTFQGGNNDPNAPIDIGIIKLYPDGRDPRVYATYLGGGGNEQPHSLIVDPQGNLIVAGRSNSNTGDSRTFYPSTAAAIGTGGGYDIVVTKLNATGTALIGSRRIGGVSNDGVNIKTTRNGVQSLQRNYGDDGRSEVILDGAGNIYVASCTQSGTGATADRFPTTAGAFQTGFGGGTQDGVVLKFNSNLSTLLFSSFLGGSKNDAAYVLSLAPSGDIFVAGGTESSDLIGNHAGTVGPSFNTGGNADASIDGFIAQISNSGSTIIRSTFIGTANADQIYGIQFDRNGFPYITGQTEGDWQVVNAAYSNPNSKQFIAKLRPDLSAYVYSTCFGTSASRPNISPTAFLVDRCENVYVSGWGGANGEPANTYPSASTTGLPTTPDALDATTDGHDFYFFVLKKDAVSQLYGSFFGQTGGRYGDHVDGGTSRFDPNGVIYQGVCANCGGGTAFPTTPGVWGPFNAALPDGCNLGMIKIAFNLAGVGSSVGATIDGVPNDTAGCFPLTVEFNDRVRNATEYIWNFGDNGSGPVYPPNPAYYALNEGPFPANPDGFVRSHTFSTVGTYRVMLIAIDPTSCNVRDTSYINIRVGDLRANMDFTFNKVGGCQALDYQFTNISTVANNGRPFTDSSFIWDFGDGSPHLVAGVGPVPVHSFPAPGSYLVRLMLNDTAYCNNPEVLDTLVSVAANVEANFVTPPLGCAPYTAEFNSSTTVGGLTFEWDFGDPASGANNTSTLANPTHVYQVPGRYRIRMVANNPNTCNLTDTAYFDIQVYDKPTAGFTFTPITPVANTPTIFSNQSSPDAVRFKWLFGDGDTLATNSRADVTHQYNVTGTFNACLVAFNAAGCTDTVCQDVSAIVEPLLDIPNAFTPNSRDINSVIMVKGYGITKIKFTIWNRWGQKVFESSDRNQGWDGKYKGTLQPMDVYAYTLEAEFFDGTRTTKKGDITLIR